MPISRLTDRACLLVEGAEAEHFLQNLVTADIPTIAPGQLRPSALLTPQGKILFDFLVGRTDTGFRLECTGCPGQTPDALQAESQGHDHSRRRCGSRDLRRGAGR